MGVFIASFPCDATRAVHLDNETKATGMKSFLVKWRPRPQAGRRVSYLASASALVSEYPRAAIHGEGHRGRAAAARSSLSTPRMTILSASSAPAATIDPGECLSQHRHFLHKPS